VRCSLRNCVLATEAHMDRDQGHLPESPFFEHNPEGLPKMSGRALLTYAVGAGSRSSHSLPARFAGTNWFSNLE
jgi:hypothetical protein